MLATRYSIKPKEPWKKFHALCLNNCFKKYFLFSLLRFKRTFYWTRKIHLQIILLSVSDDENLIISKTLLDSVAIFITLLIK